ncbi:zinc finger protein ZFAT isoform X2 [Archocentrus centrarchus]|uniref:zinc finger protein ZFAT isoform X2 n=1 Tax=Archocentrus centrarchus TaxID=63155 RepID=UPI0011E9E036|nr:zinc finger protein ZFAT isoform X2 [Archocentrus centrarchus]
MDGQKAGGSVFMCQLCNLFSPSRSQLLAHCSQLHPQHNSLDDIVIALQPLVAEPVEKLAETPVKRKRGRPKGSTKKMRADLTEGMAISSYSPEDNFEKEEKRNEEEIQQSIQKNYGKSGLECRHCHRSFSNRRQILKHICLREEDEDMVEEENGSICGAAEGEGSESVAPEGADPNQIKQTPTRPGLVRENDVGNSRSSKNNRSRISKEGGLTTGSKKSVISVVLTEDETLPGVYKMVPIEDSSAEAESAAIKPQPEAQHSAVSQSESHDAPSEATTCTVNPQTDQEPSSISTTTAAAHSRGFQEYSIKQDAANLLQSQLKIFACEFCNKIFKFRHSLVAHLRTHTQEKPFQCPHCDYASAIKANLNVHLRKHTGEKFSCQHCAFNCLSPGHLKVHIERVHMKVKQHCRFCEKKYSDVKNLLKHIEKRHNLKDPAVYQSYQQLRLKTRQGLRQLLYHCPACNRRFKNHLERERHMLVHGPQRPYACLLCDHASTKMAALAAHVRKHLFLYLCSVCNEKFVSSQRLKSHLTECHPELDQEQTLTDCINSSYYLAQPGGAMWGSEENADAQEHRIPQGREGDRTQDQDGQNGMEGEERQDVEQEQQRKEKDEEKQANKTHAESLEAVPLIDGETGREGGIEERGAQQASKDRQEEAAAEEKSHNETTDSCSSERLKEHTRTLLSPESIHSPLLEDRTKKIGRTPAEKTHTPSPSSSSSDVSAHRHLSAGPDNSQTPQSEEVSEGSHHSAFEQVFSSLQKTQLTMETFQRLRKIYGELECQYCGKLFWYRVHYNIHIRTHTKEHLHYCSKCSYSSITKSSLKRHQIQKHSDLLLPCSNPGCKYTTPDKYKLQAHMRTHQEQGRSETCPVCHRSYPEHRLKHHIKTSHPDTLPVQGKGLMVQRAEKCPYCDSYFLKNSSDFQQHIWAHQGLKPYVCSMCDYAGRSKSNLKTHMNRHNTERRHLCDLCGKKFKSKVTLKSHRLSHTDEGKRFQCSECDFTSVSKPSLLRHMEQHAKFKPFRCAHCHYSCNIAGALKRHYNVKHPHQKYENAGPGLPNPDALKQQGGIKCPECEFVYGTKWELNRHLKSKHSLKVVEGHWEVGEEVEAQYVSVGDDEHLSTLETLQDNVNIQQIAELSSETRDAVTSMVAMAPGTVTVVQQVADEQEVGNCSNQLMVVNADGALNGDQVMVLEEGHGLETLTVLTQGEDAHHYIVYVQEHTVEIN